jgi:hypothetical protein
MCRCQYTRLNSLNHLISSFGIAIMILRPGLNKFQRKIGSKTIFILLCCIVIALIVDTSIVKISAFTGGLSSSVSSIAIFTFMAVIFGVGQYFIFGFVRRGNEKNSLNQTLPLIAIHKPLSITQYVLIAIFGCIILQMVFTSSYNLLFLEVVIWINYGLAFTLLGFLSQRFLSWFKVNNDAVVLAYALAIITISINAVFGLVYMTNELIGKPAIVQPFLTPVASYGSGFDIFNSGYVITSVMSFILTWIATVLLLHSYSKKLGRAKYWILVSIPLLYFLSQFQLVFLNVFEALRVSEPILYGVVYTLFFSATISSGGVLFGIAFWSVARNIIRDEVKRYMMISAYGMMLLFSSNQLTGLVLTPYPPFGLTAVSFFGLASYLILIGIYSSAITVSEDSKLRYSIRNFARKESRLLDSIGTAHMEKEIEKRVIAVTKQNQDTLVEQTGIQSSLTEEDMKQYLEQVLNEVKKEKASTRNDPIGDK